MAFQQRQKKEGHNHLNPPCREEDFDLSPKVVPWEQVSGFGLPNAAALSPGTQARTELGLQHTEF